MEVLACGCWSWHCVLVTGAWATFALQALPHSCKGAGCAVASLTCPGQGGTTPQLALSYAPSLPGPPLQVDLAMLYDGLLPGQHVYRLRSLACRSGTGGCAFVQLPRQGAWVLSNGNRMVHAGTWADVQRECAAACIQPALLFYNAGQ